MSLAAQPRAAIVGSPLVVPKDIALFASQHSHNRTAVIDSKNKILDYLTAPAGTLALGPQGNLYDVPFNNTNALMIYHPPYKSVAITTGFGDYTTVDVTVDQHTGTYAVTAIDYQNGGSGSLVSIYTRNDRPCLTIPQPPQGFFVGGSVFDREGRLFVLLFSSQSNSYIIGEINGGCNAKRIDIDTLPSGLNPNSRLSVNKQDNLVLQNDDDVLTFAHPKHGQFSPPLATTVLPQMAYLSCLTSDGKYLWAATFQQGQRRAKVLLKFEYPSGGAPVAQIPIDGAYSCVTNPPLVP